MLKWIFFWSKAADPFNIHYLHRHKCIGSCQQAWQLAIHNSEITETLTLVVQSRLTILWCATDVKKNTKMQKQKTGNIETQDYEE